MNEKFRYEQMERWGEWASLHPRQTNINNAIPNVKRCRREVVRIVPYGHWAVMAKCCQTNIHWNVNSDKSNLCFGGEGIEQLFIMYFFVRLFYGKKVNSLNALLLIFFFKSTRRFLAKAPLSTVLTNFFDCLKLGSTFIIARSQLLIISNGAALEFGRLLIFEI